MPHMVIFRDAEGRPGYHHAEALDDAVRFVEHLRNEQQVSDTRVFSMQEVPLEFKTYWRVEVSGPSADEAPVAPSDAEPVSDEELPVDQEAVEAVPAAASGRFGLFNRN